MFAYEDRKVPGGRGKLPAPKGARLKSADVGVGRFGLSPGLSAALGSVVPEERLSEGRGRKALFPETRLGRGRERVPRGLFANLS